MYTGARHWSQESQEFEFIGDAIEVVTGLMSQESQGFDIIGVLLAGLKSRESDATIVTEAVAGLIVAVVPPCVTDGASPEHPPRTVCVCVCVNLFQ